MINFLKLVPLFSSLNDEELEAVNSLSFVRKYPKNNIIIVENEQGDTLYIILKGKVKVTKYSKNGEEIILSVLNKDDFFGDMSLLDGKPRSATVISLEDSELILLKRKDFEYTIEKHPRIALKLLRELTSRLRKADEFIGNLVFLNVTGRIAGLLLELADEHGQKTPEGILIKSRPKHQELANMIGTTRETVTRVLKQLEMKNYISMNGKDITIPNAESFKKNLYL